MEGLALLAHIDPTDQAFPYALQISKKADASSALMKSDLPSDAESLKAAFNNKADMSSALTTNDLPSGSNSLSGALDSKADVSNALTASDLPNNFGSLQELYQDLQTQIDNLNADSGGSKKGQSAAIKSSEVMLLTVLVASLALAQLAR